MARIRPKMAVDNRQIAVYVRKSKITESGKSIDIQKEKCIELARFRYKIDESDCLIHEVGSKESQVSKDKASILVYEDDGKSGFFADRPMYVKMLNDISYNKIKVVICFKIDRISRRTVDLLNLVEQMEKKNTAFVSVSDSDVDTSTRQGQLMIKLLGAIAEFERDIIAERVTDNMYELAKEGRWLGGKCPLGYRSKKERQTVNGRTTAISHLEPVPDEQRIVKLLYELFLQTSSIKGTAVKLNSMGLKTSEGNEFRDNAVKSILQNPVYAVADSDMRGYFAALEVTVHAQDTDYDGVRGMIAYNKTDQYKEAGVDSTALAPTYVKKVERRDIDEWIISIGKHMGLISGADWIRVQSVLADISANQAARPKESSKALLSGVLRCVVCGSPMYVRAISNRYTPEGDLQFYYYCETKRSKDTGNICMNPPTVNGNEIDAFVVEQIIRKSETAGDNSFGDELLNSKNTLSVKSKETEREINTIKRLLAQIELDIRNQTANLRGASENVKQAVFADIESLSEERNKQQDRLDALSEGTSEQSHQLAEIDKAIQTIKDFPRLMALVGYEGKQQLLRQILECVIVKDGLAHIFIKGTNAPPSFMSERERGDMYHTVRDSIIYQCCDELEYVFFAFDIVERVVSHTLFEVDSV